jgi:hypothetical protein
MKLVRYLYCYFFIQKNEQFAHEQIRKQRTNRICVDELTTHNNCIHNFNHFESVYIPNDSISVKIV